MHELASLHLAPAPPPPPTPPLALPCLSWLATLASLLHHGCVVILIHRSIHSLLFLSLE